MNGEQLCYEHVEPGMSLPQLVKRPTNVQLFRYSAITWNAHRIHYDFHYAQCEGYSDILVQSHLHGCFLSQLVTDWIGPRGRLLRFGWQNRRLAVPGDELTCQGVVVRKYREGNNLLVELRLEERNQRGEVCAPGTALVALPSLPDQAQGGGAA